MDKCGPQALRHFTISCSLTGEGPSPGRLARSHTALALCCAVAESAMDSGGHLASSAWRRRGSVGERSFRGLEKGLNPSSALPS